MRPAAPMRAASTFEHRAVAAADIEHRSARLQTQQIDAGLDHRRQAALESVEERDIGARVGRRVDIGETGDAAWRQGGAGVEHGGVLLNRA